MAKAKGESKGEDNVQEKLRKEWDDAIKDNILGATNLPNSYPLGGIVSCRVQARQGKIYALLAIGAASNITPSPHAKKRAAAIEAIEAVFSHCESYYEMTWEEYLETFQENKYSTYCTNQINQIEKIFAIESNEVKTFIIALLTQKMQLQERKKMQESSVVLQKEPDIEKLLKEQENRTHAMVDDLGKSKGKSNIDDTQRAGAFQIWDKMRDKLQKDASLQKPQNQDYMVCLPTLLQRLNVTMHNGNIVLCMTSSQFDAKSTGIDESKQQLLQNIGQTFGLFPVIARDYIFRHGKPALEYGFTVPECMFIIPKSKIAEFYDKIGLTKEEAIWKPETQQQAGTFLDLVGKPSASRAR